MPISKYKGALKGQKFYITAGIAILTAWGAFLTGDIEVKDALQATFTAVMAAAAAARATGGTEPKQDA